MKFIQLVISSLVLIQVSIAQTYTGVATHFEALGDPYGGCGVPTALVDSEHFVALNVFNTPNTGTQDYTRPLNGVDTILMGEFANGMNCGRWVKVTIGADCIDGMNDGAIGEEFCRGANGKWIDDEYSGAELYMVVTDACGDNNGWCRDSEFHLDLHTSSLNQFEKDGIPVGDMYPLHFNNRKIMWEYVKAPNYSGDIEIYFMQGAQHFWPAILINNLENGITAMEQKINGIWENVERNSDMGQAFILQTADEFTIRIKDIDGEYVNFGKEYTFTYPSECGGACTDAATLQPTVATFTPPLTQTVSLNKGWNLISINVHPIDSTIVSLFNGFDIKSIKTMDAFWNTSQPDFLNSLTHIEAGKGYLVKMNTEGTLNISGIPMAETQNILSLHSGWNMVGCPYQTTTSFSTEYDASNCQTIKNFDGFWMPNGTVNSIENWKAGKAYFFKK